MGEYGVLGDRYAIRAHIERQGKTLAGLSRELGLPRHAIAMCLKTPLPEFDRALAGWLGVPLHHLWPARYDANGRRRYKRAGRRPHPSMNRLRANNTKPAADVA